MKMEGLLVLSLAIWITACFHRTISSASEIREYCNMDTFIAECGENEVVVMETAHYGRMRMGKCVTRDYGNIGCRLDVRRHFDSLCSGRRKCEVKIPDDKLYNMKPCQPDVISHLEAAFTCIKVLPSRNLHQQCKQKQVIELNLPEGIISSQLADDELGRHLCPIVIRALPGQRVNITLFDFGSAISQVGRGLQATSVVCQRYALIKEKTSASPTIVCSGNERTRGVYVSDGNVVEIQLVHTRHRKESAHFLLRYSVSGCPNPRLAGHHLMDRSRDRAIVRCNHTGHQASLVCKDSKWIGDPGNCTAQSSWSVWGVLSDDWSTPHGILITVGLGVALGVVIGVTLLVCVLVCLKRRRKDTPEQNGSGGGDDHLYGRPDYTVPPGDAQEKWQSDFSNAGTLGSYPRSSLARDGHYTHGWSTDPRAGHARDNRPQDQRLIGTDGSLLPAFDRDSAVDQSPHHQGLNSFGRGMYDRTEHIYEKPS